MVFDRCWNCMEELGGRRVCTKCGFSPDRAETQTDVLPPCSILQGRYVVGNALGRGGFGITYIGFDLVLQSKIAIKEYYPASHASRNNACGNTISWQEREMAEGGWAQAGDEMLAEARQLAKTNAFPQIVSVRDTFKENNTAYIVMDYLPGQTLKRYVQENGCLDYATCVEKMLPMMESLDRVHQQGIIHRDISPDNMMLTPEGDLFLLDFGAALDMETAAREGGSATKSGFSPIEQYMGNSSGIGPWTDVYALAASIYYCVYGRLVPKAADRLNQDKLNFDGAAALPKRQADVLRKALAVQRAQRYQSVGAFVAALRESLSVSQKRIALFLGGMGLVAAVFAAAFVLFRVKPWLPHLTEASSGWESSYAWIEHAYDYMVDLDGNLCMLRFNEENQTFYLNEAEVLCPQDAAAEGDRYAFLTIGGDKLYAIHLGGEGQGNVLMEIAQDGSSYKEILSIPRPVKNVSYASISDGKRYIYYEMDAAGDAAEESYSLYRFDLAARESQLLLSGGVDWYALHGKYLYYGITGEGENPHFWVYRAALDGKDARLLDARHGCCLGFFYNDIFYQVQRTGDAGGEKWALVPCGEDGKALPGRQQNENIRAVLEAEHYTFGGGDFFYTGKDRSGASRIYRMDLDGREKLIASGNAVGTLSYANNAWIYFFDGFQDSEGTFHPIQAYEVFGDGGSKAPFDFVSEDRHAFEALAAEAYEKGRAAGVTEVPVENHVPGILTISEDAEVYAGPGTDFQKLNDLPSGSTLLFWEIRGDSSDKSWVYITCGDVYGWIPGATAAE